MVVLLVLWLTAGGQSVHGYQVTFGSLRACEAARTALIREAARLNSEDPTAVGGYTLVQPPVRLSAVCAAN